MTLKTYDINRLVVTANGVPMEGFAAGDHVIVEFSEDAYTKVVSGDGKNVTRVATNRTDGMITIRLAPTTQAAQTLARLARNDNETRSSPIAISGVDTLGGDRFFGRECWLRRDPARTFGDGLSPKEFVYDVALLEFEHGSGNPI